MRDIQKLDPTIEQEGSIRQKIIISAKKMLGLKRRDTMIPYDFATPYDIPYGFDKERTLEFLRHLNQTDFQTGNLPQDKAVLDAASR